jgi:hypothetical protein
MNNLSVRHLAAAISHHLRFLASLIARKPPIFSSEWASTAEEAFSLYTRTRTVNLLLSFSECLAEANWPFPAYLDLKKETSQSATERTLRLLKGEQWRFDDFRALLTGESVFSTAVSMGLFQSEERRRENISTAMAYFFWRHKKKIFHYWEQSPLLRGKESILKDIQRTFRKKYWAACIPTTLPLLDHLMREYAQTNDLRVSIQTLSEAFKKAEIFPKDIKPEFAIWDGTRNPDQGNTFTASLEEDLRLPGVLLSSFVEFANTYYGWYTEKRSDNPAVLNRHAIMHCASEYWTAENTIKLLTFFDLTLRLAPVLRIVIHGSDTSVIRQNNSEASLDRH